MHYLKIRAGDKENNVEDIVEIPVIFSCNPWDGNDPAMGDIYTPKHMEAVSGITQVTGWAIDDDRLWEVEIWIDGEFIEYATHGIYSTELDELLPWIPSSLRHYAGYYYELDTTNLTDGEHVLVVRTEDREEVRSLIGERTFIVDNPNKSLTPRRAGLR